MRAPPRLLEKNMNFGVRFAYDGGRCTGPADCGPLYRKYGHFAGCNRFPSLYPFPNKPNEYPDGVWFSFPGAGECNGIPTGGDDCTYSYTWPPQQIRLTDLRRKGNRNFWSDRYNQAAGREKVKAVENLFAQRYPGTKPIPEPPCDFNYERFFN